MQSNRDVKSQYHIYMPKYMPDKLFNLWIPLRIVPFFVKYNEQSKGNKYFL